jgi:hypothetical protein
MNEVQAEYLPGHGISSIEIDVSKLKLGETIQIKDLNVGDSVKIIEDPEQVVVSIKEVNVVLEEETEADDEAIETTEEATEE